MLGRVAPASSATVTERRTTPPAARTAGRSLAFSGVGEGEGMAPPVLPAPPTAERDGAGPALVCGGLRHARMPESASPALARGGRSRRPRGAGQLAHVAMGSAERLTLAVAEGHDPRRTGPTLDEVEGVVVEAVASPTARPLAPGAQLADPVELALELAPAGAGEVVPAAPHRVEAAPHLLERVAELAPLLLERPETGEDLVGRALQLHLLDRLADDREHREQRAGRAQHHLLAQRDLDQVAIVAVNERVDRLVGDEQQHL